MIPTANPSKNRSKSNQRIKKRPIGEPAKAEFDTSGDGEISIHLFKENISFSKMDLDELLRALTILILIGFTESEIVRLLSIMQASCSLDVTADDRAYIVGVIRLFEGTNPSIHLWQRDDADGLLALPTNRYISSLSVAVAA